MRRTLVVAGILAAGISAAQAQQPSYEVRPNGMGDYGVIDNQNRLMGEYRSDGMGGYSYVPTPGYRPPPALGEGLASPDSQYNDNSANDDDDDDDN